MSEAQAVVVLTLVKKPVTVADFKNNAEFYHAAALKATATYNEALTSYNRAVELENVGAGTVITFNEGKGEKAEVLTGSVITRLAAGYQVLVQYVGAAARLLVVKPCDIVNVAAPAEEVAGAPAPTPEFDATQQ